MNRKNIYRLLVLITCFGTLWEMPTAHADVFWRKAILACSKDTNQFVIRFGTLWNDDKIDKAELVKTSPDIGDLYKKFTVVPDGQCILPDGKKVRVRSSVSQAFAYGMGGADPDSGFILEVNDHPVFYKKKFYLGYGQEKFVLNSVLYDDGVLYEDVSGRLEIKDKRYPESVLSDDEKKEFYRDRVRVRLKENVSEFCKELLGSKTKPEYSKPEKIPLGFLSSFNFDLNNDGKIDKVFRIGGSSADCGVGCGTHYFDGSFLMVFTDGEEKVPQFIEDMNNIQKGRDDDYLFNLDLGIKSIEKISDWSAYFISYSASGNTARYIYNVPFGYKGTNYIEAFEVSEDGARTHSVPC